MDAYENYCLEGILKKWSTITKENVKYNTFNEIYDVFGCSAILWCIFTVLFILTFALAFINIQNKICFLVLLAVSFLSFIFSFIKIFLESYANSDELIAYLNKNVSTLSQKYNSVTDKIFTFYLSTIVALTISFISNKTDVIFNIDFDLFAFICIIYGFFLFALYEIIKFVAIRFCFDESGLLNKTRKLIDLIDVYNLTIHQDQYPTTNI